MIAAPEGFAVGASAAVRGFQVAWTSSAVRRTYAQLVKTLLVITLLLDVLGIWAVVHWTGDGESWWGLLAFLRIAGIILVLLVAPVVSLRLVNLVFPFLGERVFLAGLQATSPERAAVLAQCPGRPWWPSVRDGLVRMLAFFVTSVGCFALSFVPVLGLVLAPVLQIYFSARALGWELLDPWFDKKQMRLHEQRAFMRKHRACISGFGLPFTFIAALPIVGPLTFGLAQAAAGVLVGELEARDAATRNS